MKKFFAIIFSLVLIFSLTACKKKENLNELSANLTTYEINLNLEIKTKKVDVTQTINYINNTNSILKTLKLHLYPQFFEEGATEYIVPSTRMNNAFPNGMSYAEFNVNRVQVEEQDKTIIYENECDSILSIELSSSLLPQERTNIEIEYSFIVPNCFHRFGYGDNTINLGNFYPILCVYDGEKFNTNPYNSNGDPFYSDMANYCVSISTSKQYIVAGTGAKIKETFEGNNKKTTFEAKVVRDFALVLSNKFSVVNHTLKNTNIEYYYFNDADPNKSLQAGVDAIKTYSELFGDYPYSNYSIVQTDFVYGGMEYPNLVMISASIDNKDDFMNVIIHETAHQWWYGMIGNDAFTYPWLDEALTEFSTIIFYDYNKGYSLSHAQMVETAKENYTLFISVYEDVLGNIDTSMRSVNKYSTEPEYTYCTYTKGVLMYDSLYNLIGEKKFVESLKNYFETNKFLNTTPNDLINAFNETTKQDFNNFFSSWINGKVIIK